MQTTTETVLTDVDEARREVALFRYGVIADLTHLEPHHRGLYALLREKAEREYTIPGSLRRRVATETVRGWLRAYRRGGFDALVPRARSDQGSARSIAQPVVDLLCQLKEDDRTLSIPALISPSPQARGLGAAALRATHGRGDLPGLQRPAAQGQQSRPPLALCRCDRQGQDRHHRASRHRAARARLKEVAMRPGRGALRRRSASRFPSTAHACRYGGAGRQNNVVASRQSAALKRWITVGDNTPALPDLRSADRLVACLHEPGEALAERQGRLPVDCCVVAHALKRAPFPRPCGPATARGGPCRRRAGRRCEPGRRRPRRGTGAGRPGRAS